MKQYNIHKKLFNFRYLLSKSIYASDTNNALMHFYIIKTYNINYNVYNQVIIQIYKQTINQLGKL